MTVQSGSGGRGPDEIPSEVRCSSELVLLGLEASDREEVLRAVADTAVAAGYGEESLPDAVVAREREFPTALPTVVPVAIPHADVEHVRRPGLAVATLARPVDFVQMGSDDISIAVVAVFMPLITEARLQTSFLARLIEMLQQQEWRARFEAVSSPEGVARSTNELLYGA